MEPIVLKVNESTLEKMKKYYDSQMVPCDDPALLFKAHTIGCDISVHTDGTVELIGQNALREAQHWSKKFKKKLEALDQINTVSSHHIGSAETGSADYLGPICVVSCYVSEDDVEWIKSLGIGRVEDLTTQEIVKYAKLLKDRLVYSLLILDNSHYNKMVQDGSNLANIKAKLYNQAIVNVMQKLKQSVKIKVITQFVSPKTYFNYLKNEVIVVKDLMFESNAQDHYVAVLAAEILSRYAYLQYFANMSKSLKMNLVRGTSSTVDNIAVTIATKYGPKMLNKVAKLNFTNTKRVKSLMAEIK